MQRGARSVGRFCFLAAGLFGLLSMATAAEGIADEQAVRAALVKPIDVDFQDPTLDDIVEQLSQRSGIAVRLDRRALAEGDIGPKFRGTLQLKGTTLRSVLGQLKHQLEGGFKVQPVVNDWGLELTTYYEAERRLKTRVYDISRYLAVYPKETEELEQELDSVLRHTGIPVPGWIEEGGAGVRSFGPTGSLTVTSTFDGHDEVADLLEALQTALAVRDADEAKKEPSQRYHWIPARTLTPKESEIEKALQKPVELAFQGTTLEQLTSALSKEYKIPIVLDRPSENGLEIKADWEVVASVARANRRSLGEFLTSILRNFDVGYVVCDDILLITWVDGCPGYFARLYPVGDFAPTSEREIRRDLLDALAQVVQTHVGQPMHGWLDDGGVGVVEVLPTARALYVKTTQDAHEELAALLLDLRQTRGNSAVEVPPRPSLQSRRYALVRRKHGWLYANDQLPVTPDMLNLVRKLVRTISGDDAQHGWVEIVDDKLVVHNTARVHRQLARKLADLQIELVDPTVFQRSLPAVGAPVRP